ncbi:hypothetical protein BKA57DRAFT_477005 [Linnemannia elongata]|nr:hypothetical protein BKA57DRAFT_477005 [Linnemannia elongata]
MKGEKKGQGNGSGTCNCCVLLLGFLNCILFSVFWGTEAVGWQILNERVGTSEARGVKSAKSGFLHCDRSKYEFERCRPR